MGEKVDGQRQLRLALSMNGGVSLAVWIGGGVAEIDAVRRGEGFWGDLLEACGYERAALVDVMSGASAGGLNAVMMAEAIRRNVEFNEFLGLWERSADIGRLVKPPSRARDFDRRGVLDGRYFEEELYRAMASGPDPLPELDHDLAVFASATLVRADPVEFTDVPGVPIRESRSDAYFHVARRGVSSRGLDGFQPSSLVMANSRALAKIGRATSSLPGLFEPVRFDNGPTGDSGFSGDVFGSRLVDAFRGDTTTVEIMDGGVTDNVPISRAIRAIANSYAEGRVRRVLLYLHPDPGGFGTVDTPTNALDVVRSFFGKRSETIREDIDVLRLHNEGVRRRSEEALALLGEIVEGGGVPDDASAERQSREISRGLLLRTAVDPASELHWHAPDVARLSPLIDYGGASSKASIELDIESVLNSNPGVLIALAPRRALLTLERLIALAELPTAGAGFARVGGRLYEALLLCDLVNGYQLARYLGHGADGDPSTRLLASYSELAAVGVDPSNPPPDDVVSALASWDLTSVSGTAESGQLGECLAGMVAAVIAALPEPGSATSDGAAATVLERLRTGELSWERLQRAFMPLALEPAVSDQSIDFVRIAGDVASPASERFAAYAGRSGPKIAGTQLGHLGAFFSSDWRVNDWWWGRLDSVDALLEAVLDDTAMRNLFASEYLDDLELPDDERTVRGVKTRLLSIRQEQLIDQRLAVEPGELDAEERERRFAAWAGSDRRLSSLIGSRALTSTALRGVMTASKLLDIGRGRLARFGLLALRPVLLAATGILLAGRGAAAAAVWTFCVLMAPRIQDGQSWVVYGAGIVVAVAIVALVEGRIRPTESRLRSWPYPLAVVGAVVGVFAVAYRDSTADHVWAVVATAAIAAGFASFPLFFWTEWRTCACFVAIVLVLYGVFARLAEAGLTKWYDTPLRTLWTAWLLSIFVFPIVLGLLPDSRLRPGTRT